MQTPDGRFVIAFNGEIYNFLELRGELTRCGHSFRSGSDTEVILCAYEEWGADCFERFNGMFAIAIHDLMRDPARRLAIAQHGKIEWQTKFSMARLREDLSTFYERVIG